MPDPQSTPLFNQLLQKATSIGPQPVSGFGQDLPLPPEKDYLGRVGDFIKGIAGFGSGQGDNGIAQLLSAAAPLGGIKGLMNAEEAIPGLYSRLKRAIEGLPETVHPVKALNTAKQLASGEEIAYRKLPEFLAAQGNRPTSRASILEHLEQNPINLKVDVLGNKKSRGKIVDDLSEDFVNLPEGTHFNLAPTKWSQYKHTGGEKGSYKETLISQPSGNEKLSLAGPIEINPDSTGIIETQLRVPVVINGKNDWLFGNSEADIAQQIEAWNSTQHGWVGPHFDQPNVISSTRAQEHRLKGTTAPWEASDLAHYAQHPGEHEFTVGGSGLGISGTGFGGSIPEAEQDLLKYLNNKSKTEPQKQIPGSKGLLLENIQSDLHQKGARKGYNNVERNLGEHSESHPWKVGSTLYASHENAGSAAQDLVPDLPFKQSWPKLALKQQLLQAAKRPDLEWVGVTPGQELIRRGEGYAPADVGITHTKRTTPRVHPDFPLADQPRFNDSELPNTILKLLKEHGVERLEPGELPGAYGNTGISEPGKAIKLMLARLTPEVKASILSKGFPIMTLLGMLGLQQPPSTPETTDAR